MPRRGRDIERTVIDRARLVVTTRSYVLVADHGFEVDVTIVGRVSFRFGWTLPGGVMGSGR